MNGHLQADELLMIVAIACYIFGALALLVYFFSREAWLRNLGVPLAIVGCVAQFAQLVVRFGTDRHLAAAQSVRLALALCGDVGRDLHRLRVALQRCGSRAASCSRSRRSRSPTA